MTMMRGWPVIAACLIAPSALAGEGAAGVIQICRVTTPGDMHKDSTIEIPLGASFGDSGYGSDHRGNYWALWIATLETMTLAADQRCGAIPARVTGNPDKRPLRVADHRWFTPSPAEHSTLPGWPGNLSLAATATRDFR